MLCFCQAVLEINMIMKLYIIPLVLIKVPCQMGARDNKKLLRIIFIDKLKVGWAEVIKVKAGQSRILVIHRNISNKCHSNNIIHQIMHHRLIKFIQMRDQDFTQIHMRFHLLHIIRNMMLTNIMSHLLTLMAWSKAGRHQIVLIVLGNL